jgi:hypothetical protein
MRNSFIKSISPALFAATLAACGGGGGGDSGGGGGIAPGPITISGYVAGVQPTGAQTLSDAAVSAKCASGTGTAKSAADGKYTMSFTGTLPCVLKAVSGNETYHSLVFGTAVTCPACTANVSPLTEMLMAKFAGQAPDAYYNGFTCSPGTECIANATVQATLKSYLSPALNLDLDPNNINILTAVYGEKSSIELKTGSLLTRMSNNNKTVADLTAAILANPTDPTNVAALIP